MLNKKALFWLGNLLVILLFLGVFGCANEIRPQGGPRDVTPPVLLKATPENMTRHFASKVIKLDFDEYFKITSQSEITMSPTPDKQPEYKVKKRSLIITLKDTLQKNTTYVINFGKGIADVNEGNVLKNFTYVFSTGEHIDSLSMSGSVVNSLTQLKEKDVTVMLFPKNKDSLYFGKKKPNIYATTDTAGNFSLNNLHDGLYTIYAIKQTSNTKIYNPNNKDLIAFLKKPIALYSDTSGIQLSLFREEPTIIKLEKRFDADGRMFFIFNKRLTNPAAKIIYPAALDASKTVEFAPTKDTAYIYMHNMNFDSIRVAFLDNNKPLDSVSLMKGKNETFKAALTFRINTNSDKKLKPTSNLIITASSAIDTFDPSQITLYEDSIAVTNLTISRDTANLRALIIKYRWKPESKYILTIAEGSVNELMGNKNEKKYYTTFLVDKPVNYSTLTLKVAVPDTTKQYIVEFFQDQKNILQRDIITKNTTIIYKNFLTGKYSFRVIYDENKNGKWDSGNVKLKKYPEDIWIDPTQVALRPNWDAEEKLEIPREIVAE